MSSISQLKSDAIQPLSQDLKNKTKRNFSLQTRHCHTSTSKEQTAESRTECEDGFTADLELGRRQPNRKNPPLDSPLCQETHSQTRKQLGSSLVLSRLWEYGGKDNMCAKR